MRREHRPPRALQERARSEWLLGEKTKFQAKPRQTTRQPGSCKSAPIFHVDHFLSAAFSLDAACLYTLLYTHKQDLFWCSPLFGRNNLRHYMPTRVGMVCKSIRCQPIFGKTDLCEAPFCETSNMAQTEDLTNRSSVNQTTHPGTLKTEWHL